MSRKVLLIIGLTIVFFTSILTAAFKVQRVEASGTVYIRADGSVEPEGTPISTVDNVTYTFTDNIYDKIVVERSNITIDGANYTIQGTGDGTGLNLTSISNVTIKNMNIKDFFSPDEGIGVCFFYSSHCIITESKITNNYVGVKLFNSHHNNISRNKIMHSEGIGVWVYKSFHNTLHQNNIASSQSGIEIDDSHYISIYENNITNNNMQVRLENLSYSIFFRNNILNTGFEQNGTGLGLMHACFNNTIWSNNIENCAAGVDIRAGSSYNLLFFNNITRNRYGVYLDAFYGQFFGNKIYHNNFMGNTRQFYIGGYTTLSTNFWDNGYPSGGNFWSDYTGGDYYQGLNQNINGSDGIGDTEYSIDADNKDHYPLMGMFSDFNVTQEHHVQTICNSTISDFQFNGTAILFNVSAENGTIGFCRMCIPKALMNDTYRIFVNGTEILPAPLPLPCPNTTHSYLYFNYTHSIQEVVIVPEFPSFLILPLFMIATLLAVIIYKRKKDV